MRFRTLKIAITVPLLLVANAVILLADENASVTPTDALTAGQLGHQAGEQRRRAAIDRQLGINQDMRWFSSLRPLSYGPVPSAYAPTLDYLYANPWNGSRWSPSRFYGGPFVFEPWPYVQGDIWGYVPPSYVRQPIGQQQIQTGPNRWESRPIYAEDLNAQPPADSSEVGNDPTTTLPLGPREF